MNGFDKWTKMLGESEGLGLTALEFAVRQKESVKNMFTRVLAFDEEDFPYQASLLFDIPYEDPRRSVAELRECWRKVRDMNQYDIDHADINWQVRLSEEKDCYKISLCVHYANGAVARHDVEIPLFLVDLEELEAHEVVRQLVDEARRAEYVQKQTERQRQEAREREMLAILSMRHGM